MALCQLALIVKPLDWSSRENKNASSGANGAYWAILKESRAGGMRS